MKIHKKLGFCLGLLTLLTVLGLFLPTKASAIGATQNDAAACSNNLQFVSVAEIDCTFTPEGNTASETVKFIDSQPDDSDVLVSTNPAHKLNYAWKADMPFCDRGNTPGAGFFHDGPYYIQGITVLDIGHRSLQVGDAGNPLKVRVVLGYSTPGGSSCSPYGDGADSTADVGLTGTATAGIVNLLQFGGSGSIVSSLDLVKDGKLADKSYSLSKYQASGSGSSNIFVYTSGYTAKAAKCAGDIVIASVNSGSVTAKRYLLNTANDVDKLDSSYGDLKKFLADTTYGTTGCGVDSGATNFGGIGGSGFAISGTPPSSTTPVVCDPATDSTCVPPTPGGGGGGVTSPDAACYTWEWSWAVCPVINAAQTTANAMYGFVEDQLKFTVSDSNKTTDSLGAEHDNVKSAWNNFRILVSGLVVILLLIMIISQAIGSGPFDAYTIKKMLPRLVIGVILIQISWPMFSWVVNTVDHLGRGLADLMYAPFGGASSMTLDKVLAPFGAGNLVFNWVGLGAMAIFGVVAPFIVLGMILTVLVAIFVGFLTLLFRKIIIILALIFVPVALISWMMPNDGLRKYWKLWWDNFIKALMMFPLIVAMIAAGRIFAKIGSGQSDFVGFFIVLVGFFGPLFILPKAFKWGGTLMQTAGQGIASAGQKGLKKPKEFLGERQKGYSEERIRQSRERYLRGEGVGFNRNWQRGFGVPSLWRRPIDLIKAGQVDPTLWGRRKETAMRKYRASGAESEEADIKAADQEFGLLASQSDNHDVFARQVGGARIGDEITWTDKEAAARGEQDNRRLRVTADMKRAGMNGMTKFGTDRTFRELSRVIDELHHGNADEQILAERFLDANVGTLKPKMDYLYRGQSRVPGGSDAIPDWVLNPDTGAMELRGPVEARVGSLTPEAFASMEAPELEALLAGLSQVANHHADAAARAAAEDRLRTIYTHYEGALNNDQIRRAVGSSLNQAMKAHLDGTGIAGINTVRGQAGLTTDIEQVPTIMTPAVAAIAARIRADGTAT